MMCTDHDTPLINEYCETCGFKPDMQSIYLKEVKIPMPRSIFEGNIEYEGKDVPGLRYFNRDEKSE